MKIAEFKTVENAIYNNKREIRHLLADLEEWFDNDNTTQTLEAEIDYNGIDVFIEASVYANYIEHYEENLGTCSECEIEDIEVFNIYIEGELVETTELEKEEINKLLNAYNY